MEQTHARMYIVTHTLFPGFVHKFVYRTCTFGGSIVVGLSTVHYSFIFIIIKRISKKINNMESWYNSD